MSLSCGEGTYGVNEDAIKHRLHTDRRPISPPPFREGIGTDLPYLGMALLKRIALSLELFESRVDSIAIILNKLLEYTTEKLRDRLRPSDLSEPGERDTVERERGESSAYSQSVKKTVP